MSITIEWQAPIMLAKQSKLVEFDFDDVEAASGVYFFSRKFGSTYTPFYIGRSQNLRSRLSQHLKNANIQFILRGMKHDNLPVVGNGARYFHAGYFKPRPGQKYETCTPIVERYMINAALEEGFELLNVSLTRMATHKIAFTGAVAGRGTFNKNAETPAK